MNNPDAPQAGDPLAARLRADAAGLRRSLAPDFTNRVRKALVVTPQGRGRPSRAFLPALATAALLLTIVFVAWSDSGAREIATGERASAVPRVVEVAHPRGWGALLCEAYSEGVQGRLESELDSVMGDMGRLARGLVASLPTGLRSRVGSWK